MTAVNTAAARPAAASADKPKALLLENIHPLAESNLTDAGFSVETVGSALNEDELIERLPGVTVLGIRSRTNITETVLSAAPDLVAVGAFCIGTNQIDLTTAAEHGVTVFNAPFSNTRSVVELVVAEIISLARRLTDRNADMHAGVWSKSASGSHEIRGRSLGIVGYGNIGSQLSVVAEALGMRVHFYDKVDKLALGNAVRHETLDSLLAAADAVTLHVDGRPGNSGMFGEPEFARMRDRALFLNLSRGFVVDHAALRANIQSGHIAGAAIDVFPTEPRSKGEPFESELRGLPNVILTPHVGGSTQEAQVDIGRFVSGKLAGFFHEGNTSLSVNMPMLDVPTRSAGYRLVHTHANAPGALAAINRVLAEAGVNIDGQMLGTRGDVGYVVTDVTDLPTGVAEALQALPQTIRLRVVG